MKSQGALSEDFYRSLSQRPSSSTVHNPYQDPHLLKNLRLYFSALQQQPTEILLVGEAPGYKGCRLTGIPFTSERILRKHIHDFWLPLRNRITVYDDTAESTATIMWETLQTLPYVPILWNTFPFHPHHTDRAESNRPPTSDEVAEGRDYIRLLIQMFQPSMIAGIGRHGQRTLQQLLQSHTVHYIRHPSRGGKRQFQMDMHRIFMSIRQDSC